MSSIAKAYELLLPVMPFISALTIFVAIFGGAEAFNDWQNNKTKLNTKAKRG